MKIGMKGQQSLPPTQAKKLKLPKPGSGSSSQGQSSHSTRTTNLPAYLPSLTSIHPPPNSGPLALQPLPPPIIKIPMRILTNQHHPPISPTLHLPRGSSSPLPSHISHPIQKRSKKNSTPRPPPNLPQNPSSTSQSEAAAQPRKSSSASTTTSHITASRSSNSPAWIYLQA